MRKISVTALKTAGFTAGEQILLSGVIYTARDAAHIRFMQLLDSGQPLPFPVNGGVLYYTGPTPAPPGGIIGSCGPTTASRMDIFTPRLLALGLAATIGKGSRSPAVTEAMQAAGCLYLCAVGGAGAVLAQSVTAAEIAAFEDLGCEAVYKLTVRDMPLIVGIDARGESVFAR